MATTTGSVITSRGEALLAKLHVNGMPLKITRAAVGNGPYPTAAPFNSITALSNYMMDATIVRKINPANNQATIVSQIGSYNVPAPFDVTEAAIYADDPDIGEILYAYVSLHNNPEAMPDNTESIGKVLQLDTIILVGHVNEIEVNIIPSLFLSREEFEETLNNLDPADIGAAKVVDYPTVTLPANGWSVGTPSTQMVTVSGMEASITPIVDLLVSAAVATAIKELADWGKIGKIETGANTITAYCYDSVPENNLTFRIKAVV